MKFSFNLPNSITFVRVLLIPFFVLVLFMHSPNKNIYSAIVFGLLSISDVLDGYFARKKKLVTEFGKLIDPIADKLLISTALIFLVENGVEFWMAAVIIAREVILTAVRIYLLPSKIVVPASNLGKSKTIIQSIAIIFVLLKVPFSYYIMLLAVILTLVSGFEYLYRIKKLTGNKIVNLPNLITLSRLLLIIPFIHNFIIGEIKLAILIFVLIAISDKLDGLSARVMNQKTEVGGALDSFTDWSLIISTFVLFSVRSLVQPLTLLLLVIPALVSGTMKVIHAKAKRKVPVLFIAKLSVGMMYVTIIVVLAKIGLSLSGVDEIINKLMFATITLVYLASVGYVYKILSLKRMKLL